MSNLELRNKYISQVVDLARSVRNIGTLVVTGDDNTRCCDIRITAVPNVEGELSPVYARINYVLANELDAESSQMLERSPRRIVKKFELKEGFTLTISFVDRRAAGVDGWYRVLFDDSAAAASLGGEAVAEDRLCDVEQEKPAADNRRFTPRSEKAVEPVAAAPIPEPEPEPEPQPQPEPAPQPAQPEEQEDDSEYWEFVARNVKAARHAIATESYIRASETINLLRHMLIELICVRNGVEENFDHAIDLIECEEKDMLIRTYPAAADKRSMINALSVITELFDRLG